MANNSTNEPQPNIISAFSASLKIRTSGGFMADYAVGGLKNTSPGKAKSAMLSVMRTCMAFLITSGYEADVDHVIAEIKTRDPKNIVQAVLQRQ